MTGAERQEATTTEQALEELAKVPVEALIETLRGGRLNRLGIGGRVVLDRDATALLMSVAADRMARMAEEISAAREGLEWYAEQVAGCRKLGRIGDPFRHALDKDGGRRARKALSTSEDSTA